MVQTRRSKTANKTAVKEIKPEKLVRKTKKSQNNWDRCKDWIQQQKKEKIKVQPEELDSNDSDEEQRDLNLAPISVSAENHENVKQIILSCCEWQRCNRMFDDHVEFREHVLAHLQPTGDVFKCEWDLCGIECDDFTVFRRHVGYHCYMTRLKTTGEQLLSKRPMPACLISSRGRNLIPATDSKYVCMWKDCSYKFDMVEDFFTHAYSHCVHELEFNKQGNRNKPVQCKWLSCKKMFNKRLKMTDHMRTHTGERFVACLNCGQTINSYAKFYDHFRRQALNKNYKCYQCFQSFHTEELLNNHTSAHVNRFKCTECDMTCPSNAALVQHFRYRHLNERPFHCTECDYASVTKWDLNKHQSRMHSMEQTTYFCEECDFTCLTINQWRKHSRNEHGDGPNIYCCHCCERQYKNGASLSRHLRKIHGFRLPSGHVRFTFQLCEDGVYRVQTTRMESLEVSKQIMATHATDVTTNKNVTYTLSEFKETPNGIQMSVIETPMDVVREVDETIAESKIETKQRKQSDSEQLTKIESAKHEIDSSTFEFMECLNLKSNHSEMKNIDNFSVIKKYAKKKRQKNRITYIIEEFDEQGNMIKTQTLPPCDTEMDTEMDTSN